MDLVRPGLLFAAIQCFEVPNWETDPFLGLGSIIMVITHSSLFLETQATTPLVITHIVSFSRNSPTLSEFAYIQIQLTLFFEQCCLVTAISADRVIHTQTSPE